MTDEAMTFADVKAKLAGYGASVSPDATLTYVAKPERGSKQNIVVVERLADVTGAPDYCIHGYATCIVCDEICLLGSETQKVVSAREAYALCLPCANEHIPKVAPDARLHDHRHTDDPKDHP